MNLPSLFNNNEVWSIDPVNRMTRLQKQMDQLFQNFSNTNLPVIWDDKTFLPSCDVKEIEDHYVLSMDIPGMKKDEIKVEIKGRQLSISGERKEEKEEKKKGRYRSERIYGSFERTFVLPEDVKIDQVATEYKDGVLNIAIPKAVATKSQQIKIEESKPGFFDKLLKREQKPENTKGPERIA